VPELPEVETVRRGLEPVMADAIVASVEQRRPDLRFPFPQDFVARLTGRRILAMNRRAKYLLAHVETGDVLVMHLGMSGRFTINLPQHGRTPGQVGTFAHAAGCNPVHDHVVFHMSNGATVTYNDPRRFGYMDLVPQTAIDTCRHFAGMGIEPLGNALTPDALARMAGGRRTDLKAFLLDQRNIAGLGNIYVCEALYRARLSPKRSASCLARANGKPTARAERLVPHIRAVLDEAIAAGGSTLRDYAHTDGSLGYFQHAFQVYGREAEPCRTLGCNNTVGRIVQSGRSTFYCPNCQR
jgi:formamidopyrimidine-DNA glycosylase